MCRYKKGDIVKYSGLSGKAHYIVEDIIGDNIKVRILNDKQNVYKPKESTLMFALLPDKWSMIIPTGLDDGDKGNIYDYCSSDEDFHNNYKQCAIKTGNTVTCFGDGMFEIYKGKFIVDDEIEITYEEWKYFTLNYKNIYKDKEKYGEVKDKYECNCSASNKDECICCQCECHWTDCPGGCSCRCDNGVIVKEDEQGYSTGSSGGGGAGLERVMGGGTCTNNLNKFYNINNNTMANAIDVLTQNAIDSFVKKNEKKIDAISSYVDTNTSTIKKAFDKLNNLHMGLKRLMGDINEALAGNRINDALELIERFKDIEIYVNNILSLSANELGEIKKDKFDAEKYFN